MTTPATTAAEFVAQEEMSRNEGYWWAPDSQALLCQETDESKVEVRYVADPPWQAQAVGRPREPRTMVWLRASETLPDDPLLHVCAVTYASDLTLLDAVLLGSGLAWDEHSVTGASLDHAMWFHGPFRADEWLLYLQESPAASGARGLARGQVFRRDGRLVASVVQEGLIRVSSPE